MPASRHPKALDFREDGGACTSQQAKGTIEVKGTVETRYIGSSAFHCSNA